MIMNTIRSSRKVFQSRAIAGLENLWESTLFLEEIIVETPSRIPAIAVTGVAAGIVAVVTVVYAYSAVPLVPNHPLAALLHTLSYTAMLYILVPWVHDVWSSTKARWSRAQSYDAFMREHSEEIKAIAAESRYEKPVPLVVNKEELRYLWTPRAYYRHPIGRQACHAAWVSFVAFALLFLAHALLHDKRGMLTWGAVALAAPLVMQLVGIMSYRGRAVQDHIWNRLMAERPWILGTEEPEK